MRLLTTSLILVGLCGSGAAQTATPIKPLVVIFDENISFDHYFATYPHALNLAHEVAFHAREGTPPVNGLTPMLLEHNPNFLNVKVNKHFAVNPIRLGPTQAATADQNHGYTEEQLAFHSGLMDSFPQYTGIAGAPPEYAKQTKALVMAYFDGNTVTALWNYAQRYAMSDNSYGTTFGPSFCRGADHQTSRGADVGQNADLALGTPGDADLPAVQDEPQAERPPLLLGEQRVDLELDLDGVGLLAQTEAAHESPDMGVHRETRKPEGDTSDHVGRLSANTGEGDEVLHR